MTWDSLSPPLAWVNTTWWALVAIAFATVAYFVAGWFRTGAPATESIRRFAQCRPLLALVGVGTLLNGGYALYMSIVVPRDLMQDMVSAQEHSQGRSLYPRPMGPMIRTALENEPSPLSLAPWWPQLAQKENREYHRVVDADWVQAHPPLMSLLVEPGVRYLGFHFTDLAFCVISLLAVLMSLGLIRAGLSLPLTPSLWLVITIAVVGWYPVTYMLRNGQSDGILCGLMVLGWFGLRRNRPIAAGVAIGFAASLKMFPGLLLVYLLLRHRRAFVSALVTMSALFVVTGLLCGWHTFIEFFETAKYVVELYSGHDNNISLLGLLAHASQGMGIPLSVLKLSASAIGAMIVLALAGQVVKTAAENGTPGSRLDVEYSLFVALMPLLSPIAWQHYLVSLLLPLFVLGKSVFQAELSARRTLGFFVLLAVLSIPEEALQLIYLRLAGAVSWRIALSVLSTSTFGLMILSIWMARIHGRSAISSATSKPLGFVEPPTEILGAPNVG